MKVERYETLFLDEFVEQITKTKKKAGSIILRNKGELPLDNSKVGGVGYSPKNRPYPIGVSGTPFTYSHS